MISTLFLVIWTQKYCLSSKLFMGSFIGGKGWSISRKKKIVFLELCADAISELQVSMKSSLYIYKTVAITTMNITVNFRYKQPKLLSRNLYLLHYWLSVQILKFKNSQRLWFLSPTLNRKRTRTHDLISIALLHSKVGCLYWKCHHCYLNFIVKEFKMSIDTTSI